MHSIGTKGIYIQMMSEAGLPVPRTWTLDQDKIGRWLDGIPGHREALQSWSEWTGPEVPEPEGLAIFRRELEASSPPSNWAACFSEIISNINGDEKIIVRSSMNFEDGIDLSFAGTFRSVVCRDDSQ